MNLKLLITALLLNSCTTDPLKEQQENSVYQYFHGAELQVETDDQRHVITQALRDMLILPAPQLHQKRYSNYQGIPNQWPIETLIMKHFVPDAPRSINNDQFDQELESPEVKEQLKSWIHKIDRP